MAYNYEYPYFDTGNFNSDWLINKMKELEETVIGLETFKYVGENEILDLNQQKQNSIAEFTSNFNVLNSPVSNVQRVTVTYGSETAYIQQLYDLSKYTVYTRNYSTATGWTAWKLTQNAPGTVISTSEHLTTGDFNDLPDNKALFLYTNAMQHAPVNGYGYLLTWRATNDEAKIQVFFSTDNGFIYLRGFSGTNWSAWAEANHIDLTHYLKAVNSYSSSDDLNALPKNRVTVALESASNIPIAGNFHVMCISSANSNDIMQIAFQRGTNELWLRTNANGKWTNLTKNPKVLHTLNKTDSNDITSNTFNSGLSINTPGTNRSTIIGFGTSEAGDCYQIAILFNRYMACRFGQNGSYNDWKVFAHQSERTLNVVGNIPYTEITLDDGSIKPIYEDTIYSEISTDVKVDYTTLPGQSLLHSDEGKQSFKDAILAADLSDTDVIMTNLEMWDMDIPLDTIAEEVAALADAITAKNPMCELTLLSIPPIDIPLWGDELLDYTMPNGSTLRQVDDRLFRLSEEHQFNYTSFEYFYDAQNANLLEYLGEDFKTNKQYLRRVGSFIKNTI